MSLDDGKWLVYKDQCTEAQKCIGQSKKMDNQLPCYQFLYELKPSISEEVFGFYFRTILNMGTRNVPKELRLKMFEGVKPENIMYQDELDTINNDFDDYITVYRGASKEEEDPGISWSTSKDVAESFYRGRLFEARIPKTSILLCLNNDADEFEVVAQVERADCKIIKEDQE